MQNLQHTSITAFRNSRAFLVYFAGAIEEDLADLSLFSLLVIMRTSGYAESSAGGLDGVKQSPIKSSLEIEHFNQT